MSNRKLYRRLSQAPPPFGIPPVADAWRAMEEKLRQRRRRVAIWWWTGAMSLLFLIGFGVTAKLNLISGRRALPSQQNDTKHPGNAANPSVPQLAKMISVPVSAPYAPGKVEKKSHSRTAPELNDSIDTSEQRATGEKDLAKDSAGKYSGMEAFSPDHEVLKSKKPDSAASETGLVNPESEEKTDLTFQAGLQWSLAVPFHGGGAYFSGPEGGAQAYRILYPALWGRLGNDRFEAVVVAAPFASTVFGHQPYRHESVTGSAGTGDASFVAHKVFGYNLSFEGAKKISGNWWAGADVSGNFWRKGMQTVTLRMPEQANMTSNRAISDSAWSDFSGFQPGVGAVLSYKETRWQAGGRVNLYFVPVFDAKGQRNQLTAELFFRWTLWSPREK